jgi:ATP-dependent DNA helicase RecQ
MIMKERIREILKNYWGYDHFRPLQEEIIMSVLEDKDTLALLPTGGGKSICFQVPALALEGLCIVVSPLIALMKDQVENLKNKKIKATAIYSGMSQHEIELIINNAVLSNDYKFLYVSPERLKTSLFRLNLKKMNVSLIAVDEAHCISQWGYDFRPPYLEIAEIRQFFPQVPVLALTATATPEVVIDIQEKLLFKNKNVFQKSFKRENLTYYVVKEEDKQNRMLRLMQRNPGTGIVYVRNRRKTREIAEFLNRNGIAADYYHAGLDSAVRDARQRDWMSGKTRVIVSTNAFGMGIDKPDVRFVVHLDIPDTLEAYFQEAGRGGRDEKPSIAVMLYDDADLKELQNNFELSFPEMTTIKKVYRDLANYFGIEIGSGENSAYPFDIDDFAKQIKLKPLVLFNCISFLEKIGVILLTENTRNPSSVHFKLKSEDFEKFYTLYPDIENFVKLLLRSYSGLFTDYVRINESLLARRMNIEENIVEEYLVNLSKIGAIDYKPRTGKPELFFVENRVDEKYLYFEDAIYKRRKLVARKRLDAVLNFVNCTDRCRSDLLLDYFGEKRSKSCGKCDVCVKIHQLNVPAQEFNRIAEAVKIGFKEGNVNLKELVFSLSGKYPEEKVIKVVRYLIDKGEIKK